MHPTSSVPAFSVPAFTALGALLAVLGGACTGGTTGTPAPATAAGTAAATGAATPAPGAAAAAAVTVVGTNYCLGCALKKEHAAAADCATYGHRHGLRVERAVDATGRELSALAGRTLAYLDNASSAPLLKGDVFHNERVQVRGRLFEPESVLEVAEYGAP